MQHEHDFPHPLVDCATGMPPFSRQAAFPSTHAASRTPSAELPVSIRHVRGQKPGKSGDGGVGETGGLLLFPLPPPLPPPP